MNESNKCPQCGAEMEAKTLGGMNLKSLVCAHCGYVINEPGDFSESKTVDTVLPDGSSRVVKVFSKKFSTHLDLTGKAGQGASGLNIGTHTYSHTEKFSLDPKTGKVKLVESSGDLPPELQEKLGQALNKGGTANSGQDREMLKSVLSPEMLEAIRKKAEDPKNINAEQDRKTYQLLKDVSEGKTPGPGVSFQFKSSITPEMQQFQNISTTPAQSNALTIIKWLALLAALALVIVWVLKSAF